MQTVAPFVVDETHQMSMSDTYKRLQTELWYMFQQQVYGLEPPEVLEIIARYHIANVVVGCVDYGQIGLDRCSETSPAKPEPHKIIGRVHQCRDVKPKVFLSLHVEVLREQQNLISMQQVVA